MSLGDFVAYFEKLKCSLSKNILVYVRTVINISANYERKGINIPYEIDLIN